MGKPRVIELKKNSAKFNAKISSNRQVTVPSNLPAFSPQDLIEVSIKLIKKAPA